MHDAIEFERRGIPAAVICSDKFLATGQAMAEARGFSSYPIVKVRHPVVAMTPEEVAEEVEKSLPQVLAILLAAEDKRL